MTSQSILIVEDELDLAENLSIILETLGYQADLVSTLSGLEEYLQNETASAIFLDLHLPGTHPTELIDYVRGANESAKIILFTGDLELSHRLGDLADGVLNKPFSWNDLQTLLDNLLDPTLA